MAVGDQTSLADRKRRAGQRLIVGLSGHAVDDDLRALVREVRPAGFILFARNVVEPAQVHELNRELASLVDPHDPAFLSIDQEGGRVQRVREPATRWPSAREVGGAAGLTVEVSRAMALELRAMGFNLNFAPCADVDSNPANPVIGDRSFGSDPARVAEHVVQHLRAHQEAGVIACVKHFPGHGDTSVDSHLDLPVVDKELPDLLDCELRPFAAAVAAGVGSVMTAHVVFPALDEEHPATLSAKVTRHLLRERFGFDGVVFSDDMDMKAVAGRWPVADQVRLATEASVDMFLCCNDVQTQYATFHALVRDQEASATADRAARDAVDRVCAMRVRFLQPRPPLPLADVGSLDHRMLAARAGGRMA
ncbi:MAG: beta-N-acetylhexosaminidase [Myxococcota bacterium]|jgi:beta-N-acetylhexosaminidase